MWPNGMDSIQGMDTQRLDYPGRFRTYVLPNPDLGHRKSAAWNHASQRRHVYTAEIDESMIGELDPETARSLTTNADAEYAAYNSFGLEGQRLVSEMQGKSQNRQAGRRNQEDHGI